MLSSWWYLWIAFMFFCAVSPLGYGWGYRGWGPPYPRYVQRRRAERAIRRSDGSGFDHQSWGVAGDFLWGVFLIGTFWAFMGLLWR